MSGEEILKDPADIPQMRISNVGGYQRTKRIYKMKLNYAGYMDLLEENYLRLVRKDANFAEEVPLSLFTYYHSALLFKRHVFVGASQRDHTYVGWEHEIGEYIPDELVTHPSILFYLNCIGPVEDLFSRQWHIKLPVYADISYSGIQGNFGDLDSNNHFEYSSSLSPFIPLITLGHELASTQIENGGAWMFPLEMQGNYYLEHNRNLLGCTPVVVASQKIKYKLKTLNWTASLETSKRLSLNFNLIHLLNFPISPPVLKYVSNSIKKIDSSAVFSRLNSKVGSLSQIPYVTHPDVKDNEISQRRISQCNTCVFSTMRTSEECAKAALIFRFRTWYEPSSKISYCVNFKDYSSPPAKWQKLVNATFEYGDQSRINHWDYNLVTTSGEDVTKEFVANFDAEELPTY